MNDDLIAEARRRADVIDYYTSRHLAFSPKDHARFFRELADALEAAENRLKAVAALADRADANAKDSDLAARAAAESDDGHALRLCENDRFTHEMYARRIRRALGVTE